MRLSPRPQPDGVISAAKLASVTLGKSSSIPPTSSGCSASKGETLARARGGAQIAALAVHPLARTRGNGCRDDVYVEVNSPAPLTAGITLLLIGTENASASPGERASHNPGDADVSIPRHMDRGKAGCRWQGKEPTWTEKHARPSCFRTTDRDAPPGALQ
jgi:hypothetical protein